MKTRKAQFGWTVIARNYTKCGYHVYKRSSPAEGYAADLAPYTHPTRALAREAGKRGDFAYKRDSPEMLVPVRLVCANTLPMLPKK